jgi:hypothetical protein
MSLQASLSAASIVVRRTAVVEAEVDGEVIALDIDNGTCYGLNLVGSRIWKIIAEPSRIDDVCTRLISEYEVDAETCQRDVLSLLEELRGDDLIEVRAALSGVAEHAS